MKIVVSIALAGLLLTSCRKEEAKPQVAPAPAKKVEPEKKKAPLVPQGELPKMDPDKAKFIAAPSTPKDPESKKDEKPAVEAKKAEAPVGEIKKADKPATEATK